MDNDIKVAVIGAGPGGYEAALHAAELGMKTVLIEERELGGTCLNRGCIPTKSLMHSAGIYQNVKQAAEYGVDVTVHAVNQAVMYEKKDLAVETLRNGIERLLKNANISVIKGKASDVREGRFTVTTTEEVKEIKAEHILLATGSRPYRIPIEGSQEDGVVTSDEILAEPKNYKSLIIIGGGVIGTEFAGLWNALDCEVTMLEAADRILPLLDKELGQGMAVSLKKKGVRIQTGVTVVRIEKTADALCVYFEEKGRLQSVCAEGVLLAVGRQANTEGLFAEEAMVQKGRIIVNERFETKWKNVYAIGDAICFTSGKNTIQLAHAATAQGLAVVDAIHGKGQEADLSVIPSCVYTSPEIASAGITAEEAKELGLETVSGKYLMLSNGKTILSGGERGFIKLLFEKETKKLLGAQFLCDRATDMIGEMVTAIVNGMTCDQIIKGVRPHPTFQEGIKEAAKNALIK